MVPTPPAAHAGEAQVEYHWLGKLARWLELGREKVAILVEEASPGGLRPLVSMLLEREPLVVCFHVTELLDVPAGSLVVLTLHEAELNWINLNRPIIATKRLRLVLWLEFPLHRLKAKAPDFFDWISHVVRCPRFPPQLTVRKLRDARAAQRPVAWRGQHLDAALDRIGEGPRRIEARGTFAQLVAALEKVSDGIPVWTGVHDPWHLLRVELAMLHTGRPWWVVEHPGMIDSRYAAIDDETLPWEVATERLGPTSTVTDRSKAACIAALLESDPRGVESSVLARAEGQSLDEILARSRSVPASSTGSGPIGHAPPPAFAELLRRHARALRDDRSSAWIAAADFARAAGHADVAQCFAERALVRAKSEAARDRAKLALAAADRDAGAYGEAHERFFELVERLGWALGEAHAHDPRLAVVLTEQAALLVQEEQHAAAADDAAQAIEIWETRPWRPLGRAHLAALRVHARCLAAQGRASDLPQWLAQRSLHWPVGEQGALELELERARIGDRHASERVALRMRDRPPDACIEAIGLDLAELQLEQGDPRAAVASCVLVLRALRAIHGTDLHPHGIDARLLVGKALAQRDPRRACRFLRRALDDCEIIHGQTPHRRTLRVVTCLAEVERRRGDLAEALVLAARAGELESASESSSGDVLDAPPAAPMDTRPTPGLVEGGHIEALLSELDAPEAGLGARLARDPQALEMFIAREAPRLVQRFRRRGLGDDGARELVQEALLDFVIAVRHPKAPITSTRALLQHIARVKLSKPPTDPLPEPAMLALADPQLDVERILSQLSPHERSTVELRYLAGWSWREIADTLGLSEPLVRSIASRSIQRLRRQWSLR